MNAKHPYKTEADLCAAFIGLAEGAGHLPRPPFLQLSE